MCRSCAARRPSTKVGRSAQGERGARPIGRLPATEAGKIVEPARLLLDGEPIGAQESGSCAPPTAPAFPARPAVRSCAPRAPPAAARRRETSRPARRSRARDRRRPAPASRRSSSRRGAQQYQLAPAGQRGDGEGDRVAVRRGAQRAGPHHAVGAMLGQRRPAAADAHAAFARLSRRQRELEPALRRFGGRLRRPANGAHAHRRLVVGECVVVGELALVDQRQLLLGGTPRLLGRGKSCACA